MAATPLTSSSFSNSRIDRVHYGKGCLAQLPGEVDRLGGSQVFIITGNSLKQQGGSWAESEIYWVTALQGFLPKPISSCMVSRWLKDRLSF